MRLSTCSTALALSFLALGTLAAQPATQQAGDERQEFAVTVGEMSGGSPNAPAGSLTLDAGVAVEANFARKIREMSFGSVYWEVDGMVGPLRYLTGTPSTAAHEIHSVFLTPGIKLQFTPKEPISPWVAAGAGYAFYDSSSSSIGGGKTGGGTVSTGGTANTYAVDFGGGVDFALGKRYLLRAGMRGFYTGAPNFGVIAPGGQFNFVIGGGFVFRFSK